MNKQNLMANWNYPTQIRVGPGRVNELASACSELGIRAPLLVTDPGLASSVLVEKAVQQCHISGLNIGVFSQIKNNPTGDNVMNGVELYHSGAYDGVIAFGGGSGLDTAKAIALMVGQSRSLWDFEDIGDNWKRVNSHGMAPVVAIPTTAGTGSEVGRASVITDTNEQVKKIIFHPKMMPSIVILDPELTIGLPKAMTAATGMDALSHCLEAYCTSYFHPMAEGIALEGIRLIKDYLLRAYQNGHDLEARTYMLVASSMGATSFQRGLGAMHALAHPLGVLYDAHHGRLNAILMPYVLKANRVAIEDKIKRLADYLLIRNGFEGFLDWVVNLRMELGIEPNLAQIGIDNKQVDRVAKMATEDAAAVCNSILFTKEQYQSILEEAIEGR